MTYGRFKYTLGGWFWFSPSERKWIHTGNDTKAIAFILKRELGLNRRS